MRLGSLRNTRDERIRLAGRRSSVGEEETTVNDRAKSKGEKDGGPEDRTWLEQLMPGEPLGVTRPVTSYLDTFSLAPPPSLAVASSVLPSTRVLVATPRLVVMEVHLRARVSKEIQSAPSSSSSSLSHHASRRVSSLLLPSRPVPSRPGR